LKNYFAAGGMVCAKIKIKFYFVPV
jgi:hypothetical protein